MTRLSVLDLSPIIRGGNASLALQNTLDLARHAERWGYQRFWVAEHHNMPGIASAATSVVIAHVASGTQTIRVGAGGIMLPNHAPLLIAEQFGTLDALFPGRIDLGLGRAPGSDQLTQRALRVDPRASETFADDVLELQAWFREGKPNQTVRAVPGAGANVPLWILGSSLFGAQLAAALGLPFAFASHFAPGQLMAALDVYRRTFRASEACARPYVMLGVNIFAADTEAEARLHATSLQQAFVNLRRGQPGPLPPPDPEFPQRMTPQEHAMLNDALACSWIGTPEMIQSGVSAFLERTGADELMVACQAFDHSARLRSFELAFAALGARQAG